VFGSAKRQQAPLCVFYELSNWLTLFSKHWKWDSAKIEKRKENGGVVNPNSVSPLPVR
jgi:hypothetical protein